MAINDIVNWINAAEDLSPTQMMAALLGAGGQRYNGSQNIPQSGTSDAGAPIFSMKGDMVTGPSLQDVSDGQIGGGTFSKTPMYDYSKLQAANQAADAADTAADIKRVQDRITHHEGYADNNARDLQALLAIQGQQAKEGGLPAAEVQKMLLQNQLDTQKGLTLDQAKAGLENKQKIGDNLKERLGSTQSINNLLDGLEASIPADASKMGAAARMLESYPITNSKIAQYNDSVVPITDALTQLITKRFGVAPATRLADLVTLGNRNPDTVKKNIAIFRKVANGDENAMLNVLSASGVSPDVISKLSGQAGQMPASQGVAAPAGNPPTRQINGVNYVKVDGGWKRVG